jgi:molybdopterin-guanine dinucleotide biosynthesis protein A
MDARRTATPNTAVGAVLAGGAGSRIGGAKAKVELGGRPLICHPLAALTEAGLEPLVIAKADTELPTLDARVVREEPIESHPLHGVLAAMRAAAGRPVVVVACDMPFVTASLLAWIATLPGTAMPLLDGALQPLLARYEPHAAAALAVAAREGRSARAAAAALAPIAIDEDRLGRFGDPRRLLLNVNDEHDLARARGLLSSGV